MTKITLLIARLVTNRLVLLFLLIIAVGIWAMRPPASGSSSALADKPAKNSVRTYAVATTTQMPVPVSGVVEATNSVVVRAKIAGVVTSLPVREGDKVAVGSLLVTQDTSVVQAQYGLAVAETGLSAVQNEAVVAARQAATVTQTMNALSASEIANIRQVGNSASVEAATKQLTTTLDGAVGQLVAVLDFVDQNRSFFPAAGMTEYRNIVAALYDRQPNYLAGSVMYSVTSNSDIIARLEEFKASAAPDVVAIQTLAELVDAQLVALTTLLATGEDDIFNHRIVAPSDSIYNQYLAERASVVTMESAVRSALAEVKNAVSAASVDTVAQGTNVAVTQADAEEAKRQATLAAAVAAASAKVAARNAGVLEAEVGLGSVRAPFAGAVSSVETDIGAYLQPGSPILTVVGTTGKELSVTVPSTFVAELKAGQEFVSGGKVVGYVDRFSPVSEQGSVLVIIEIIDEQIAVGDSMTGYILVSGGTAKTISLPRAYVHFTSLGAAVTTEAGVQIPVKIIYDYGETLFVEGYLPENSVLLPTISGQW